MKFYGENVNLVMDSYANNGNLYLGLVTEEGEPYCDITVNLDFLMPEYGFVDTNNVSGIEGFIKENKLGTPTGTFKQSGFCTYPLYKFNMEKIKQLCTEPNAESTESEDKTLDKDYVLNNLRIAVQKNSDDEETVKRPSGLEGIESYLYLCTGNSSEVVTDNMLENTGITKEEAWKCAEENTNAETTLTSMAKTMCRMMGMEYSEEMDKPNASNNEMPLFILSNESKIKGASAILNKKVLAEFGKKYHTKKIIVLPSSIHEMLLAPYTKRKTLEELSEMVKDINETEVAPAERLTDRAYILEV